VKFVLAEERVEHQAHNSTVCSLRGRRWHWRNAWASSIQHNRAQPDGGWN